MPKLAQALKWAAMLTEPPVRLEFRTDQYWLKVEVPSIEGWLTRCVWRIRYVLPSTLTVPFCCAADDGSYEPKFSTT